jgi:hypothetical protein
MSINEEQKTNARKLSLVSAATSAAPVTVTYNDKDGREKTESYAIS